MSGAITSNEDRVERAEAAIAAYLAAKGVEPDTDKEDLVDLMADLLHYADSRGFDTEAIIASAEMHHDAEVGGDPEMCECGRGAEECATFNDPEADHADAQNL